MTALELNAEIYRNLGSLADDERYLKKVVGYLKRLAKDKEAESRAVMTKSEIKSGLAQACTEMRQHLDGKLPLGKWEDLYNELRN